MRPGMRVEFVEKDLLLECRGYHLRLAVPFSVLHHFVAGFSKISNATKYFPLHELHITETDTSVLLLIVS